VEVHVTKISEAIHGFHTCIVDIEALLTPNMPLEEREMRKKSATKIVDSVKKLEVELSSCTQILWVFGNN
jgi:hypothetical protein